MLTADGSEAPLVEGREQMKLLADLEVTAKVVERAAESLGEDTEASNSKTAGAPTRLSFPAMLACRFRIGYVQMDGTQAFVVKSETGTVRGQRQLRPSPARANWARCLSRPALMIRAARCGAGSTTCVGPIESAEEFGLRLPTEAWNRGSDRASIRAVTGDGSRWI